MAAINELLSPSSHFIHTMKSCTIGAMKPQLSKDARQLAWGLAAAVATGILLFAAFPPLGQSDAAWIALVPLLCALRGCTPRRGAIVGLVAGLVFWLGSLSWLVSLGTNGGPLALVCIGGAALAAYCSLYMAWFGALDSWAWGRLGLNRNAWTRLIGTILVEPLLWTGCEFARGWFLTGFPWNALGVSQYENLPLIQSAAIGGVWIVSFLLTMMNGAVAAIVMKAIACFRAMAHREPGAKMHLRAVELLVAAIVVCAFSIWGAKRIRAEARNESSLDPCAVALIQPYMPSVFEISEEEFDTALAEAIERTECAAAARPDLVVWPESSIPGTLPYDPVAIGCISNIAAAAETESLIGALEFIPGPGWEFTNGAKYYNSSYLVDAQGIARDCYRKQHLVPCGEYVPFENIFPALKKLLPVGDSCTPGEACVVMSLPLRDKRGALPISSLICFEDIMPYLARRAAKGGARLLVNQSNDAWFDGSCEPRQHLAQSVFRAVENGIPLVRSANGGISGLVDSIGRTTLLTSDDKDSGFSGFLVARVFPPAADRPPTLYTRIGDWACGLPSLCVTIIATLFLSLRRRPSSATPADKQQSSK